MIEVVGGSAVVEALQEVLARPEKYREVALVCPFIDDDVAAFVVELARRSERGHLGFRLETNCASRDRVLTLLGDHPARWTSRIRCLKNLHAKVYLFVGRRGRDSRAIASSANLTLAGAVRNVELGVSARPTSNAGSRLFSDLQEFVRKAAA